jgi:hypothetical protein
MMLRTEYIQIRQSAGIGSRDTKAADQAGGRFGRKVNVGQAKAIMGQQA